ncbi:MAG: NgoFVII family restriction endonuclease [Peptococcaceae bacterium]|nr:NgoFVII family restriction endonuclease [Peptococcaceae bacterium]
MENLSLFDLQSGTDKKVSSAGNLDVVEMEFKEVHTLEWQELFGGFDTLHAIVYSSSIKFVYQLLEQFEYAEILFGSESIMEYSFQEIMAYQCKTVERLRDTADKLKFDLVSRIDDETLRMYVARDIFSHAKVYLLSAKDGRKRVVMGSANLSMSAFTGKNRESICFIDGDAAYEWYMSCFEDLKEHCTDKISKEAFVISDAEENLEELPIVETVRVKKAIVLEPVTELTEEVKFVLDVKNLAVQLAPSVPKADKKGKFVLSPDKIKIMKKKVLDEKQREKELRSVYPHLVVSVESASASLNDKELDLHPSAENIVKDVTLFLNYMNGYEKFHGDVIGMQYRYFEFANWFFCSPFMATMRAAAVRANQNLLPYPVFGLVYGQSKAGKTSFLETLLKMMIGQKVKISAPEFTRSSIEGLKRTVKGAPIIVDDLTNTRFNQHAIETIKNDDFGIADRMVHYPAVVISANEDVKAVAPEVIRRTVICRVQAGLTNTEVMRSSVVRTVQREIGTAFYREYLRRMLEIMPDLLEQMEDDSIEGAPDILAVSSDIIVEIFSEYSDSSLPEYVRNLTLEDYFSERVTGSYAIKTIQMAWRMNQDAFEILERANELRYNAGATWEADRIMKELPETLEARKSRESIVMNLTEARLFFGVTFKKSWLRRWRKKN